MSELKYITKRIDRETIIKGTFEGKYIGYPDMQKSDAFHERFFDLEILEGEIKTVLGDIVRWHESKETAGHDTVNRFVLRSPSLINVELLYLDGTIKYFKIKLQELNLVNCRLSKQVHEGNKVFGTIEGDVTGYLLHYDSLIEEVREFEKPVIKEPDPVKPELVSPSNTRIPKSGPTIDPKISDDKKMGCGGLSFILSILALLFIGLLAPHFFAGAFSLWLVVFIFYWLFKWLSKKNGFSGRFLLRVLFGIVLLFLLAFIIRELYNTMVNVNPLVKHDRTKNTISVEDQKAIQLRKDSFDFYYNAALQNRKENKKERALESLERASVFALPDQKTQVNKLKWETLGIYAEDLFKKHLYGNAIPLYSQLISMEPNRSEHYYKRALCYEKTKKIQEAVNDLKRAIDLGDGTAKLLYDKINPVQTKIAYYCTLCCDGTTSSATGRGACSHHGGVCEWNYPVYKEYRKY